ncbi:MAG: HAD family hydrolase [Oscillospiraceae bacterium]|nr:HAD family hydrolase [Oscillospiraceae bacterium]
MVKLIASDIDGTLLDADKKIPAQFDSLLHTLAQYGIRFVIASGRSYSAVSHLFCDYHDLSTFICDNGAFIVTDGIVTDISIISRPTLAMILDILEHTENAYPVLCGRNGTYVTRESEARITDSLSHYYNNVVICESLDEVHDEIFKIAVCDTKDPQTNSYAALSKIFGSKLSLQVSGASWMDIMNGGINKGCALRKIQQQQKITEKETMAFGDYYNDIEMLSCARYSYVMENANDDMKQYGRYLCEGNDKNGVINTVYRYLEKNRNDLSERTLKAAASAGTSI